MRQKSNESLNALFLPENAVFDDRWRPVPGVSHRRVL